MPFGLRDGPSNFQQVMQNVLSPFLWIFALVYIDGIVVFFITFNEHLRHLDNVFGSIANSGITLSPGKCFLGYQSLLLLGQKVSRHGLSTHREKKNAIVALEVPRNVSELQTFLGMMVYFSAYIPYYDRSAFVPTPAEGSTMEWGPLEQEAFDLSKGVLTRAPVRAFAIAGKSYRIYSDACDTGVTCILQQVQPITIEDLRGTKLHER